jgi:hypothetical protein
MRVIPRFLSGLSACKIWQNHKNANAQYAMRKFHALTIAQGTLVCEEAIAWISNHAPSALKIDSLQISE